MFDAPEKIEEAARELFQQYRPAAARIMADPIRPDFFIGDNYLQRWWLAKIEREHEPERYGPMRGHTERTTDYNMYLHRVTGSDDDRAMHDHPWPNVSLILEGRYLEHTPVGEFYRNPGDMVYRSAESLHRLELLSGPAWSLFLTGRKVREWGFLCPEIGWRHWKVFTSYDETGQSNYVGRGCGE